MKSTTRFVDGGFGSENLRFTFCGKIFLSRTFSKLKFNTSAVSFGLSISRLIILSALASPFFKLITLAMGAFSSALKSSSAELGRIIKSNLLIAPFVRSAALSSSELTKSSSELTNIFVISTLS